MLPVAGIVVTGPPGAAPDAAPVAQGVRPVADAVADDESSQDCDQEGGYAVTGLPEALDRYDVSRVWTRATGRGVRVAVVDSGINVANPHFVNGGPYGDAYAEGTSFLPASLEQEYVNVYEPHGWADPSGHGTAVAGIIGARPAEGSGVVGLAPYATIVPVQVFGAVEDPTEQDPELLPDTGRLADGIRWAADAGVQVIAVSMSVAEPDPRLEDAVAYAGSRGALVVASAGSALTAPAGDPGGVHYPAGFPGVLGVAPVGSDGRPSEQTFTGSHVDVAAPGQLVATAYRGLLDCYLSEEPTPSYAVPYVAATAALLAEQFPDEGPDLWAHRIMMSAERPRQGSRDDVLGWGAVSPHDALTLTIDASRPGPPVPGHPPAQTGTDVVGPAVAGPRSEPWAPARRTGLLLAAGGVGLVAAVALARALGRGRRDATD
ncbi:hypothetical protein CAE01nite_29640 [Cellulomonas aerilata]|uniref:Peptidase S8/S53 domain-containing protein n=2 Tax=Cellulomonas aerilata TaxID=515326 RepID=A0A512DFG3_9CELL|nr:hypothetical protein CAE01nite_29640 [Cellulomonas aerilata]